MWRIGIQRPICTIVSRSDSNDPFLTIVAWSFLTVCFPRSSPIDFNYPICYQGPIGMRRFLFYDRRPIKFKDQLYLVRWPIRFIAVVGQSVVTLPFLRPLANRNPTITFLRSMADRGLTSNPFYNIVGRSVWMVPFCDGGRPESNDPCITI